MTINGPGPINVSVPATTPGGIQAPRNAGTARPAEASGAAQAPRGTNPRLWELLTGEEQAFFSQIEHLGPVTYAPRAQRVTEPGPPMGQRLDVRG